MTPRLTIREILHKHLYEAPRGTKLQCSKDLGFGQRDLSRWLSGVVIPGGDQAVRLLQYFGELKNYPNEKTRAQL